jgi:hypothetical protein
LAEEYVTTGSVQSGHGIDAASAGVFNPGFDYTPYIVSIQILAVD